MHIWQGAGIGNRGGGNNGEGVDVLFQRAIMHLEFSTRASPHFLSWIEFDRDGLSFLFPFRISIEKCYEKLLFRTNTFVFPLISIERGLFDESDF